jgi:REP element-mobilizing transposase RayT
MSDAVYSEINFHITWHTKNSLPMIRERIEDRLYHYLTHRILETPEVRLHAIGGIETHVHIGLSAPPSLLISDYIGQLKGSSSHYINHEIEPKALQWQRGYGIDLRDKRPAVGDWLHQKSEGTSSTRNDA